MKEIKLFLICFLSVIFTVRAQDITIQEGNNGYSGYQDLVLCDMKGFNLMYMMKYLGGASKEFILAEYKC